MSASRLRFETKPAPLLPVDKALTACQRVAATRILGEHCQRPGVPLFRDLTELQEEQLRDADRA